MVLISHGDLSGIDYTLPARATKHSAFTVWYIRHDPQLGMIYATMLIATRQMSSERGIASPHVSPVCEVLYG